MKNKSTKNETGAIQIHVYSTGNNIAQTINQTFNGNVYYGQNTDEKQEVTDEQLADAISSICGKVQCQGTGEWHHLYHQHETRYQVSVSLNW